MKKIKKGDVFKVPEGGTDMAYLKRGDARTFKCIDEKTVELIKPSQMQEDMEKCFRDGTWKKTAINKVERQWYTQKGFEIV